MCSRATTTNHRPDSTRRRRGYKFIIVVAGIHNNLRKRTQQRIDEAFIGRSSDPEDRRNIGVGLAPGYPHPATLTNINEGLQQEHGGKERLEDQRLQQADHSGHQEERHDAHGSSQMAEELNAEGDGRISDVPILLIDDGPTTRRSTRTKDLDPDPTKYDDPAHLGLFAKSCYVGYGDAFAKYLHQPRCLWR